MKKMTSPTSWFGLRSKCNSKRSVSPKSASAPLSNSVSSLRSSTRSDQAQTDEKLARRGAQPEPTVSSEPQGYSYQTPRAESRSVSEVQSETSRFSSGDDTLQSNTEELVKTYLSWINAHLKKRKDSEKVSNLSTASRDGITLLNLAEVLSGKEITGAVRVPKTREDREHNVSRVLSFLQGEGLDVATLSPTQIMEGNLKHILKVIFSMACHYRATPIQQTLSFTEGHKVSMQSSPSVNEYANLKQQVNEFEKKLRGNALIEKYRRMSINSSILSDVENGGVGYETDDTVCDSEVNYEVKPNCHKAEPVYVNVCLSQHSRPAAETKSDILVENDILRVKDTSSDLISTSDSVVHTSKENSVKNRSVHIYSENTRAQILTPAVNQESIENCFDNLSVSLSDLSPIKQRIIEVQKVLGCPTEFSGLFPDVSSQQSRIAELEMKLADIDCQLSESEEQRQKVSSELSIVIQECTALSVRLTESLSIRADVLRKDYLLQNSESENLSLRIAVREKDEIIKHLNVKFNLREELITTLEKQVSEFNREKERQIKGRVPAIGPHPTHPNLSEAPEVPAHLSTKVKEVCDVMFTLRARVSKDPACNQLMDSVEDGLYAIVERLYYYAARPAKRNSREGRRGQRLSGRNQVTESPNSTLNRSSSSTNSLRAECTDLDANELVVFDICQCPNTPESQNTTRVLCYVDRQQTPSRITLHKPSSLVTLSDIKSQIHKVGKYSYYFKVHDPDFGTVKEEVANETDFVPVYKKNTVVVCLESNEV